VSYTKGCYVGQETVARVHFRGHVNRLLRGVAWEGAPPEQDEITLGNKSVGRISSAMQVEERGYGLAMLRREVEPGAEVVIAGIPATVERLPFRFPPSPRNAQQKAPDRSDPGRLTTVKRGTYCVLVVSRAMLSAGAAAAALSAGAEAGTQWPPQRCQPPEPARPSARRPPAPEGRQPSRTSTSELLGYGGGRAVKYCFGPSLSPVSNSPPR
jgi:hypothetical protein